LVKIFHYFTDASDIEAIEKRWILLLPVKAGIITKAIYPPVCVRRVGKVYWIDAASFIAHDKDAHYCT